MGEKETKNITANAFLTTKEFADHLQVNPGTVRDWIKGGALYAITTPRGTYRIPIAELTKLGIEKETTSEQDKCDEGGCQ